MVINRACNAAINVYYMDGALFDKSPHANHDLQYLVAPITTGYINIYKYDTSRARMCVIFFFFLEKVSNSRQIESKKKI